MCTQLAWMHATSEHTMSTTCTHALRSRYPCAERRRGGQKGGQKGGRKGTRRTRPKAQSISTPAMWANMGMAASSAKPKPVRKSSLKKVPLPQQLARQVCRPRTTRAGVPCRCRARAGGLAGWRGGEGGRRGGGARGDKRETEGT